MMDDTTDILTLGWGCETAGLGGVSGVGVQGGVVPPPPQLWNGGEEFVTLEAWQMF